MLSGLTRRRHRWRRLAAIARAPLCFSIFYYFFIESARDAAGCVAGPGSPCTTSRRNLVWFEPASRAVLVLADNHGKRPRRAPGRDCHHVQRALGVPVGTDCNEQGLRDSEMEQSLCRGFVRTPRHGVARNVRKEN